MRTLISALTLFCAALGAPSALAQTATSSVVSTPPIAPDGPGLAPRLSPEPPPPAPPPAPTERMPMLQRRSAPEAPPAPPTPPRVETPPSPAAAKKEVVPDHQKVVGRYGLGFEGVSEVPLGLNAGGIVRVPAPALGVRWWWSERIGLDVALGLGFSTGGGEVESGTQPALTPQTIESPTATVVTSRVGVPYAVYVGRHFTFLAQAHLLFGYARQKSTTTVNQFPNPTTTDVIQKGYRLEGALQGGAEVQFGFIGLPELALQGTVGLFVRHEWVRQANGLNVTRFSQTVVATSVTNDPWDFFRAAVAARYYF